MNCILRVSSTAWFSQTSHVVTSSSLFGFNSKWKRNMLNAGIKVNRLHFELMRFNVWCYSTRRGRASQSQQVDPGLSMDEESNAFYVVRKGDVVGIYKNFDDCQAQVGTSICDPPVSIYKGYSLSKDAKEHLACHGLKNAMYTMNAMDLKEDLFGSLRPCPFQQPRGPVPSPCETPKNTSLKRLPEMVELDNHVGAGGSSSVSADSSRKHPKLRSLSEGTQISDQLSCVLEFDGASKGNPGKAGAGAILRTEDGSIVWRLREGLGVATNNVAEYRAMILGMKYALKKGFKQIRCQGDSKLVCMQMKNKWQVKNLNMMALWKEAKELKDKFVSFEISHIERELNSDADAQANLAVNLGSGEICENCDSG